MSRTYTCALCKGTFESEWSEEEALAERRENGWEDVECDVVCDDCYRKIMPHD